MLRNTTVFLGLILFSSFEQIRSKSYNNPLMNSERQPNSRLLNCSYGGETCAIGGCWYEGLINKVQQFDMEPEKKAEIIQELLREAAQSGCLKAK